MCLIFKLRRQETPTKTQIVYKWFKVSEKTAQKLLQNPRAPFTCYSPYRKNRHNINFSKVGPWRSSRQEEGLTNNERRFETICTGFHVYSEQDDASRMGRGAGRPVVVIAFKAEPEHFVAHGTCYVSQSAVYTKLTPYRVKAVCKAWKTFDIKANNK